jgi:hypothetical protein
MNMQETYLGEGMEGVVHRRGAIVVKRFRPGALSDCDAQALASLLPKLCHCFPEGASLVRKGQTWELSYNWFDSMPVDHIHKDETVAFLGSCLRVGIVPDNFKLANLRRAAGGLVYIDLGKQVRHLTQSAFRDTCAKAYALMSGIMSEDQLVSGFSAFRASGSIERMDGFPQFYSNVIGLYADWCWQSQSGFAAHEVSVAADVTLMIKCCAMDASYLIRQVSHLVWQLSDPSKFAEVVLLIDPKPRDFTRQHTQGDIDSVRASALALVESGVVDRVLEAPQEPRAIKSLNLAWFGVDSSFSHTSSGVPVFPQVWCFEQLRTRYVLQADCDVLVGRYSRGHDYIAEMISAHQPEDVMGVGFNIPQPEGAVTRPYHAPAGEYKPEVRLGLFDLPRLFASLPWPNAASPSGLALGWYQSLHKVLGQRGFRCLRGGDPRTFYIHPLNSLKSANGLIDEVRSIMEAGCVPPVQAEKWDVVGDPTIWRPPLRSEDIVFLVMGRNTPQSKISRCLRSLHCQRDQDFGVIIIDDASDPMIASAIARDAAFLRGRLTLVHNSRRIGRVGNKWRAVHELVVPESTMVVVLDMDDALISPDTVDILKSARGKGADLVVGGVFRPDKPLKLYPVDFSQAAAHRGSGNVWCHLRAFTRAAFLKLSEDDLKINGQWVDEVSDYLTMVPMTVRTQRHATLDGFLYLHERSTPCSPMKRASDDQMIDWVLARNRA